MELTISILAFIVSFATFLFSVLVTYMGEQREKKEATLDALNILQEQQEVCNCYFCFLYILHLKIGTICAAMELGKRRETSEAYSLFRLLGE